VISISLCMIVKNEEAVIGRCLDSVQGIADEINIVDTGSVDKTKDIAARYTDRIFDFEWTDDFAAARNFSFQQATTDYILWLDADDVFTENDQEILLDLKGTLDSRIDAVSIK
jgi:glycosyltransferase involved in cell wall biosynthesis